MKGIARSSGPYSTGEEEWGEEEEDDLTMSDGDDGLEHELENALEEQAKEEVEAVAKEGWSPEEMEEDIWKDLHKAEELEKDRKFNEAAEAKKKEILAGLAGKQGADVGIGRWIGTTAEGQVGPAGKGALVRTQQEEIELLARISTSAVISNEQLAPVDNTPTAVKTKTPSITPIPRYRTRSTTRVERELPSLKQSIYSMSRTIRLEQDSRRKRSKTTKRGKAKLAPAGVAATGKPFAERVTKDPSNSKLTSKKKRSHKRKAKHEKGEKGGVQSLGVTKDTKKEDADRMPVVTGDGSHLGNSSQIHEASQIKDKPQSQDTKKLNSDETGAIK
ncbi:hypothetical protein B0O99DRAFT_695255 [Bisporella sp. PMI_857]|nr:hypothetical protein B0O99DRAFT_695255 [Bisporella sp. PMI_857]